MNRTARDEILGKLKAAPKSDLTPRPCAPPPIEISWTKEQMIENFTENLLRETAVVHRVENYGEAAEKLAEIARSENITKMMASTDDVISNLKLHEWGPGNGVEVLTREQFRDRVAFKQAVFNDVQAGVTGVDGAVAESGTLCLVHDKNQPRLVSLAPKTHIAVVPVERLYSVYENATDRIFREKGKLPSQVSFITGPSMTADILGVPFKGMHGPKRLIVVLVG